MSKRWDDHFLHLCLVHAGMSKDTSTKVGAVIIGPDREIVSTGFNGLPRGIADTPERISNRELKLKLVVHAEMNAILNAARTGACALRGLTLYLAATDSTGTVWGGAPCTRCTVELIQAGIAKIVTWPFKNVPSRWLEDITFACELLREAGVSYREVTP